MIPTRRVTSQNDLELFQSSETFSQLVQFIQDLQDSVIGLANDAELPTSKVSNQISKVLSDVSTVIDNNPVVEDTSSRFGKSEFRDFYDQVSSKCPKWLEEICSSNVDEISTYFIESWGNKTRIDYGSGHELNFICFLFCLQKLELIAAEDYSSIVLIVFNQYISIMRRLQKTYWLEPAGSHGVWGLDDYHFLPFLFGSAQLSTHEHMRPKSIHNQDLVEMFYKKYMYFECIHFINSIKTLPSGNGEKLSIRWHSPMLDDISSAKSWLKIKEGMVKMYKAEVLSKLPIIQHFMFGELIACPEGISEGELDECGHVHGRELINTWGDCCGIKVPSAIAASESIKRARPVPFD